MELYQKKNTRGNKLIKYINIFIMGIDMSFVFIYNGKSNFYG